MFQFVFVEGMLTPFVNPFISCAHAHTHACTADVNAVGGTCSLWRDVSWRASCETGLAGWEMGSHEWQAYSKSQPCQARGCRELTSCDLPWGVLWKRVTSFLKAFARSNRKKDLCEKTVPRKGFYASASSPPQISLHLMNKKDVKFMCIH